MSAHTPGNRVLPSISGVGWRSKHAQAWRAQLWLGVNNRGPLTASGIYQVLARRGRQCGVDVYPHRFRHHFSHTWLDRGVWAIRLALWDGGHTQAHAGQVSG